MLGRPFPGFKIGYWWAIATGIGFGLGALALALVPNLAIWMHWEAGQPVLSGTIFGLVAGAAQWLVLQQRLPRASGWVWASIVGSAVGFTLLDLQTTDPLFPLYALALGASVGIAQWMFLRRQVAYASIWILTSMLSAVLISITPVMVLSGFTWGLEIGLRSLAIVALVLGLACLALSGGIQGGTLIWLLEK